jgi:hypothetical protein
MAAGVASIASDLLGIPFVPRALFALNPAFTRCSVGTLVHLGRRWLRHA